MESSSPVTVQNPFAERLAQEEQKTPASEAGNGGNREVPATLSVPAVQSRNDQIAIVEGELQLTNIEQVWRAAKLIRQSGLAPASFQNDQQIVIAILRALELKIPIFQALEGMSVIKGRIGIMGDLALALVQASGELKDCSVAYSGEGDEFTCTVTLHRKGGRPHAYSFSVAQAKRAQLWGKPGPWTQYPDRMLRYRALGFGLRDEFPATLKGIRTVEELADFPENSR